MFNWPLNTNSFSLFDKLKIAKFILTDDQWTQGKYVKKYEEKWSEYTGSEAVMVSSGSAANELIALRTKHELMKFGKWPEKNKVFFPANTWISSVSPWINFGFEPVFVDIDEGLGMSYSEFMKKLKEFPIKQIAGVFYTTLLGFCPDTILNIKTECNSQGLFFKLDNCEASFSSIERGANVENINNLATSSTSFYLSHLTTSGSEGGMVFCNSEEEHKWYLLARSHGMTKTIIPYYGGIEANKYRNWKVDERFDFNLMGSNYRSSDFAAYPALLDFERRDEYIINRTELYDQFSCSIRSEISMPDLGLGVPFALPIICETPELLSRVSFYCWNNEIEYRPIVGGNLLRHTAFKDYGKPENYPYAEFIHKNGIYIGLNSSVTAKMIETFCNGVSKL